MAETLITVTDAEVLASSRGTTYTAGEAIGAGLAVYKSSSDNKVYKALSNSAAHAAVIGFTANGCYAANQPINVVSGGTIVLSASAFGTTREQAYALSSTAGKICLRSDLAAGKYVTEVGWCTAAGTLTINIDATGAALAA